MCFKPIRKVTASVGVDLELKTVPGTDVQEDVMTCVSTNKKHVLRSYDQLQPIRHKYLPVLVPHSTGTLGYPVLKSSYAK